MSNDNIGFDSKADEQIEHGDLEHGDGGQKEGDRPWLGETWYWTIKEPVVLDDRARCDALENFIHIQNTLPENGVLLE